MESERSEWMYEQGYEAGSEVAFARLWVTGFVMFVLRVVLGSLV